MNNKGFTLIELLATLVVLSIVVGLTVGVVSFNLDKTKEKTEEVFVDTIKDAVDVYLSSSFSDLKVGSECANKLSKKYGDVSVYEVTKKDGSLLTFSDVIYSSYHPITKAELVNPANEEVECSISAVIDVYRDADYVYYYSIDKSGLNCLKNMSGEYEAVISNLPEGYVCE